MAKAKASESNSGSKSIEIKTAPKIADVTADASVGATAGSRPVIVSNRPIMRDPMMVASTSPKTPVDEKTSGSSTSSDSSSTGEPGGAPLLSAKLEPPSVTKKRLVPPSEKQADTEPAQKAADITGSDESNKTTTKIAVAGITAHDSIPESPKVSEPTKDDSASSDTENSDKDSAVGDESNEGSDSNEATDTEEANKRLDEANQLEDTREADEAAKVAKLVESKAYLLPINAVQRRRSQQMAVLGLVVIILLAFAWLDLAADVGLVKAPYLPVTHFFSH
jgi:hypothetical protein